MPTQPAEQPTDPGRSSDTEIRRPEHEALRLEVGRMRYAIEQLNVALFGGPGVRGMREEHAVATAELKSTDRILAERINDLIWPKILAVTFTGVGVVIVACGIEVFLIKLHELHVLGVW